MTNSLDHVYNCQVWWLQVIIIRNGANARVKEENDKVITPWNIGQGPVVQNVVSLTSSLRVILLTVLADSIYNFLIIFAEKMWVAFALQKLLSFFQQKISAYLRIAWFKF